MPAPEARAVEPSGSPVDLLGALAAAQHAFAALLTEADLDAPVPACGTWTVTDLALHLGGVHRWAADMARGADSDDTDPTEPRERAALLAFYREQAALLHATLHELGPDAPALTLVGPGPAAFWHRRQVHETLIHLHDLADAVGRADPLDDPALWADTVDEVVTVMAPRQVRLGRIAAPWQPVALAATDGARTWLLGGPATGAPGTRRDTDEVVAGGGPAATTATTQVAGPARTLALLLWGRTSADDPRLAITGDRTVLDDALARALTP